MKGAFRFLRSNIELLTWVVGLIFFIVINPEKTHFSFCLFHHLGIDFCTGCGIGTGISFLLHGKIQEGMNTHWLSLPTLIILIIRIIRLSLPFFHLHLHKPLKQPTYGSEHAHVASGIRSRRTGVY